MEFCRGFRSLSFWHFKSLIIKFGFKIWSFYYFYSAICITFEVLLVKCILIWKGKLFVNVRFIVSVYKRQQQQKTLWFIMVYYFLILCLIDIVKTLLQYFFYTFFVFVFIVCYMPRKQHCFSSNESKQSKFN